MPSRDLVGSPPKPREAVRGGYGSLRFRERPWLPYCASIGAKGKLALLWEEGWRGVAETGRSKRQKRERRCNAEAVFTYAGSPLSPTAPVPPSRRGATVTAAFGNSRRFHGIPARSRFAARGKTL